MITHLFDDKTFYDSFIRDLLFCTREVIIESPYITASRMKLLSPIFETLIRRNIATYIITRDPREHDEKLTQQSEKAIRWFEIVGIHALLCSGNDHRKLAILDRRILWEGSLNILSQTRSREIMRRIEGRRPALEMFQFLKLGHFI